MAIDGPCIRVTDDGPYEVRGSPPLVRVAHIETEHGEPIDWTEPERLAAGRRFSLCRCGRSRTKPFCDDSHLEPGFDGTEVADRGRRTTRAKTFVGDGVVMTDDRSICSHAGFCVNRVATVWEMIDDTADPEIRERLEHMVSRCPSGALDRAPSVAADPIEPVFEPSIGVVRDGPLWVRGGIPVEAADGFAYEVRNRVTLCRCGHSSNKPFCDGTHLDIAFRDG
jgi:CDGSH-type Zn-finger protein